ncbi:uncharacterized protein CANTADRAFT_6633 [Suhomyces tanzawaensis NRRL Y-17324]|uniref:Uncharacterized protein n=1 Tax=Suhomyces tanzawaensis NRRL Y-17324 TaxID=984487 RepID=A0A1E4SJ41_9ASCO|nr:uncharacterized protein CANTADRAFT_6633 [Suhomyces tanzawaensis NRRL Y-17324]ODV79519.1 hypothetical protein CANTADRAFT_6633 [Suhomyces tanzawaensis NRRL Y-17324]
MDPLTPVPASVKLALTIGAVTGATVAFIANREQVLETAESMFENGARFCRAQLERSRKNKMFADAHEDNWFANQNLSNVDDSDSSDDDMTTPDASDFAASPETSDYYDSDDDEHEEVQMRRRRMSDEVKGHIEEVD